MLHYIKQSNEFSNLYTFNLDDKFYKGIYEFICIKYNYVRPHTFNEVLHLVQHAVLRKDFIPHCYKLLTRSNHVELLVSLLVLMRYLNRVIFFIDEN